MPRTSPAPPAERDAAATTAITGVGVTAPNGLGTEECWRATLAGRSGLGRISRFDPSRYPATVAGEVHGYVAEDHIPSRLLPQTDHQTRLSLTAAEWALRHARLDPAEIEDFAVGVATAASAGAVEFGQRELQNLWSQGKDHVSAYQSFAWFYAVNNGQISIRHGMRGPGGVLITEQAGGLDSLAQARRFVRKGASVIVSGGVDGGLCPLGWVHYLTTGLVSTESAPDRAYLPFSDAACGFVPGEGGAILIAEDARHARERGVPALATVAGYAATLDPPPWTGRPPRLGDAMANAISDAGLRPGDVDVVFADAAGDRKGDAAEADALRELFGPRGVPVTAPKTMTGRLFAGGAALDAAYAVLSLRDGVIPPTVNVAEPAPEYEMDLVTGRPRRADVRTALVVARGHGGFNAAVVLRAPE
ncbi:ketosynthase chain-length factor [Actinomadura rugatobispora]|uniref:Ketosynthase chain-length factor n=1 Tax=Actinomadura rugatobispora TaxID=1994 RepID=A0ABW0ZU32_9ACTN